MANQNLNSYAIGVAVTGEGQLIKLGNEIEKVGIKVDRLNKKMGSKTATTQTTRAADKTVTSNKRVAKSSSTRTKQVSADQAAERRSIAKTNATLRMQSARFQRYNTKIQASSRLTKNEITDMFRRVALWSTGIGVLFGTLSKIKFIFGAVRDLEVQMAELKKVMDDDTPFKTAQRALFQTALSMSVSVDKAAEIAKTWAQQGYELKDVAELTKTALLGVNAANLTAGQSVEFLTSAIKSFKIEAEETTGVIDAIMSIQADFAITSANLAKGLQVAGAITAQLGGDMNELFGMMTAVGEITRETGNVIGNSLKTQLARIQQPRTIAYLERLGIATRRITDEGMVKRLSAFDIFKQISKQRIEGALTKDQILDISLKIGGIRKFKDALILIENFDTALAASHTGFLAYGDASEASGIIQETLARKLDKLNTAFVELGDTIANIGEMSGLESLKAIVSGFTGLIGGLTKVARGESALGGVGAAAFQVLPLAIIGGFAKFLGKRIFQNIRGTELRSVQEMANIGQTPIGRTVAQSRYMFFGKEAIDPKFAKDWGQEMRNINKEAKKAGISMTPAHKQMAFMSTRAKMMDSDIGNLGKTAGKFRTRWNLMGRALRSTLLPGTIPGTASRAMQQSGMLATARIMSSIGNLAKGLVGMGAFLLAIEGLIKAFEYIKSLRPNVIDFEGVVDPASQASLAFANLAGTLKDVKKEARDAKIDLDEFLKNRSFSDKAIDLQPIAEEAGRVLFASLFEGLEKEIPKFNAKTFREFAKSRDIAAITLPDKDKDLEILYNNITKTLKDGAVNNRAVFKKFLTSIGIDEADIPTEEITKKFQKAFRDFLKFEIAGDLAKSAKESNQNLGELLDRLKKGFKDAKVDFGDFSKTSIGGALAFSLEKSLAGVGITGFKDFVDRLSQDIVGVSESEKLFANLISGFVSNFGIISEAFKDAKQDIGGKSFAEVFGIKDQESIASAINKVVNKWKEVGEKSDKLPALHEIIGEYFDKALGTFSPGAELRSSIKAGGGGITPEQEALQNIRDAARAHIDASLKAIANQGLALVQAFTGLERPLPNSLKLFSEAALDAAFALLKIPDLIFNKLSDFVAEINKIKIRESLSNILGTGDANPAQAILDAGRKWITTSVEIFPAIESGVRKAANVQERVKQAFKDDTYGFGAVLKLVDQDVISLNTAFGKIKDIVAKNKNAQDTGIKKAASETQRIIIDVMKVREAERLLKTEMDTAVKSWTNLTGIVKDAFGVDIGGEVDIKKMFFEAFETGDTKLLEKALGGLVDGWIDDAANVIKNIGLEKLSTEMQQKTNKLLSFGKRLYKTGVDVVDTQINSIIDTQIKLGELDISAGLLRKQLAGTAAKGLDREKIISALALNEAEKQSTIQMQALALSMGQMAIEADKITGATDTARQAFTQLFADVKRFDPKTDEPTFAFEDAFNQIANVRLEFISERFTNQLLAGFESVMGSQFGEFILGEELKDPLDINTDALGNLTMSVDELRLVIAQTMGLPAGGVTGIERFGSFEDIMGGETFSEKARQIESGLEQLSEIFDEGGSKIEFSIDDILAGAGQILGGFAGTIAARGAGKDPNAVNIGTAIGSAAGEEWLPFLSSFAGPVGSILGGILGGLFGRDKEIQEQQNENLHRIADNTAELVAVDRRIINAPASFTLPAGAQGGSLQWSGNIIVQGGNTNEDTARVVLDVINRQFRSSTSNYNTVAGA